MHEKSKQLRMRFPLPVLDALSKLADENGISLNDQLIATLESALSIQPTLEQADKYDNGQQQ